MLILQHIPVNSCEIALPKIQGFRSHFQKTNYTNVYEKLWTSGYLVYVTRTTRIHSVVMGLSNERFG